MLKSHLKLFRFHLKSEETIIHVFISRFENINQIHRLHFEQWWFCESGYQIVSYFAICHAWERQKHNLSFNVHCSKTMRWIYLIIGMTNCHILGFNLPFTELIYLIWFLCKSRLNRDDRTPDTLYFAWLKYVLLKACSLAVFSREKGGGAKTF